MKQIDIGGKCRHRTTVGRACFVSIAILVSPNAIADNDSQRQCLLGAFNAYNAADLAILQTAAPILSVEGVIARRRLEEKYCLEVARCLVGDPDGPHLQLPFEAEFSKCLREETIEKENDSN
jgi:hypothetical protein